MRLKINTTSKLFVVIKKITNLPVSFYIPDQGAGQCPSIADEAQGPYRLTDVGEENIVAENVKHRLLV